MVNAIDAISWFIRKGANLRQLQDPSSIHNYNEALKGAYSVTCNQELRLCG